MAARPLQLEVADIFRQHGPEYRQAHAETLSRGQRRVMGAIECCRTAALGGHVERCDACGHLRIAFNSCRDRHCPKCQSLARARWLEERQAELLEVEYFHVVFTLPEPIAALAYQNKKLLYDMLFHASAQTLHTIAADPEHLGAEIGFLAILHTWGQNLLHHPHVHCVVPGGGISPDGSRWIGCRPGFFLPVRVLSRLFRRLFLEALQDDTDVPNGWRMALKRMDARGLKLGEPTADGKWVSLEIADLEPELKQASDQAGARMERTNRISRLRTWAAAVTGRFSSADPATAERYSLASEPYEEFHRLCEEEENEEGGVYELMSAQ